LETVKGQHDRRDHVTRTTKLQLGTRVKVIQTIPRRDRPWDTQVEGVVVRHEAKQTGSWFAHACKGRLWLNRLTIRKDDGEQVVLSLDEHSRVVLCEAAV
jgi:hypothetical protein